MQKLLANHAHPTTILRQVQHLREMEDGLQRRDVLGVFGLFRLFGLERSQIRLDCVAVQRADAVVVLQRLHRGADVEPRRCVLAVLLALL